MARAFVEENRTKYNNRLSIDFPFYSRWCLQIKTKEGALSPFILNRAQEYLHKKVEEQKNATGRVRVLILKGRQQGMSTYIAGRFYWLTTRNKGKSTFILSHQSDTTEKLFGIVERMHNYCPEPVRMVTDVANRRRMVLESCSRCVMCGRRSESLCRR